MGINHIFLNNQIFLGKFGIKHGETSPKYDLPRIFENLEPNANQVLFVHTRFRDRSISHT